MQPDKLIHMANQIAKFFAHQGDTAAAGIADHLVKFWDPRMRRDLGALVTAGKAAGLEPAAAAAVRQVIERDRQS